MGVWGTVLAVPMALLVQDAPERMLGSRWVGADGNQREARVVLTMAHAEHADPELYRRAEHDWAASNLDAGLYPAMRGEREGRVKVRLTIAADGTLQGCTVTRPSGVAELDAHGCPHLLTYARFFPALGRDGRRRAATVDAAMTYTIRIYMNGLAEGGAPTAPVLRRQARPEAPITLTTLGISGKPPANVYGINAALAVAADGAVTACTLTGPSQIDATDKAACDRAMALRFTPALDQSGQPVASHFAFGIQWPR